MSEPALDPLHSNALSTMCIDCLCTKTAPASVHLKIGVDTETATYRGASFHPECLVKRGLTPWMLT